MYQNLTAQTEALARELVNIAFTIHKELGPGLLESVYERCFSYELDSRSIPYERQKEVPIRYNGMVMDDGLRLDILVDNQIVVELKAHENYHPVWEAQLLSYLRLTDKRLGFLFNFHVKLMKDGIKRMVR